MLEDWVSAAKEIERCDRTESYYKDRSRNKTPASSSTNANKAPAKPSPKTTPNQGKYNRADRDTQEATTGDMPQAAPKPPYRAKEYRTRPYLGARRKESPKVTHNNGHNGSSSKRCYNCNETGHFADQCSKPKRQRDFVRATRTTMGDHDDADNEEEEERRDAESEHSTRDDSSSTVETNPNDHDDGHVIEVPAGDFYEGVDVS